MDVKNEILIIGGGLAGLTAAIHLSKIGFTVSVLEKNEYPKHKVCGEYISNEVVPYLQWLDIDITELAPTTITKIKFSTANGKVICGNLPLGGFGISRYTLDAYLYKKALSHGAKIISETAETILFENNQFTVTTSNTTVFKVPIVIGAFGKRSTIDQKLNRSFIQKKSPWLAVKAHYSGDFPNDLVGLYNFKGGYCGVSKVENDKINICYLADYESFKNFKNIEEYQKEVLSKNPLLKAIFKKYTLLFDKPLSISQISFEKKEAVNNHVLLIGDTAGLIHPLCGNGMAMAIHSAKIVSELVEKYDVKTQNSRIEMEEKYIQEWNFNFKKRIRTGRFLSHILQQQTLSEILMHFLTWFPMLLPKIVKKTHGKPIIPNL